MQETDCSSIDKLKIHFFLYLDSVKCSRNPANVETPLSQSHQFVNVPPTLIVIYQN